jgi:DNA-binding PadR family transcriptional regulator
MFSPEKDMKEIIIDVLRKDPASISGISRELEARGVKLHRLELTGYLKALASMGILREKYIKPAKVFSISPSGQKSFHELLGEACSMLVATPDERATLAVYSLQKVFRRAVFDMEVRRCGLEGSVAGRKASAEERSEAKSVLVRQGYKVPNSDIPTIVEQDLDSEFSKVMAYMLVERFDLLPFVKETTQTRL